MERPEEEVDDTDTSEDVPLSLFDSVEESLIDSSNRCFFAGEGF